MTWRQQPDGTYISDSSPYIAAPIGGGDYSLSCLDPKEDKRFLSFSEILGASFYPLPPALMTLDDGTAFLIKSIQGTIANGATSASIPHGVPALLSSGRYICHFCVNAYAAGSAATLAFDPATNSITSVLFNDNNMNISRTGTSGTPTCTTILFYKA